MSELQKIIHYKTIVKVLYMEDAKPLWKIQIFFSSGRKNF